MKYKAGYKYQLNEQHSMMTGIKTFNGAISNFIVLDADGHIKVLPGYAWDGASGPTFDTKNSMTPSLIHDCFCQLIREEKISPKYRKPADKLFHRMCRQCGMGKIRAWIWYRGVRFGAKYNEQKPKPVLEAP